MKNVEINERKREGVRWYDRKQYQAEKQVPKEKILSGRSELRSDNRHSTAHGGFP